MPHNNSKKIKQELESLLEKKEMAEEARAELLDSNHVLKLHEPVAEETVAPAAPEYIKEPEDMERIKSNTQNEALAQKQEDYVTTEENNAAQNFTSPVAQMFEMQLQFVDNVMSQWSQIFGLMASGNSPVSKKEKESESA